jgi:hypothetical protein
MTMSDCSKCWDCPCTCGWDYRYWSVKQIESQIYMLQKVLQFKMHNPTMNFSGFSNGETTEELKFLKWMRHTK